MYIHISGDGRVEGRRTHARPFVGVFKSQFWHDGFIFWRYTPVKWLHGRTQRNLGYPYGGPRMVHLGEGNSKHQTLNTRH